MATARLRYGIAADRPTRGESKVSKASGARLDFLPPRRPSDDLRGKTGHLFPDTAIMVESNGGLDRSRGERLTSSRYENQNLDPQLAAKVAALFETGMWSSKRALYHDLIRRGLMEVLASAPVQALVPPSPPPPAPTAIPSMGPRASDAQAESSASHRPRRRSGRPSRTPERAEKESLVPANSVGAGAASVEAVEPSIPPAAVPGTTRDGGSSPASATTAPATLARPEATWTCPACKGTFPLEERWVHKPKCPAVGSAAPEVPVPGPSRIDEERLRDRLRGSLRDASRSSNPRAYLIALIPRGVEEQRLPSPSDAEAARMLEALARRDPDVGRLLRGVAP